MILNLRLLKKVLCLTLLSNNYTIFKAMNSEVDFFSKKIRGNKVKTLSNLTQHKIIQYLLDNKNLDLKLLDTNSLEKLKKRIVKLNLTKLFEKESKIVDCKKIAQKNTKVIAFKDNKNIAVGYNAIPEDNDELGHENLAYLKLYNLENQEFVKEFNEPLRISTLIINPNGKIALLGTFDGQIILLDLEQNQSKRISVQSLKSRHTRYNKCDIQTLDVSKDWQFAIAGGICSKIVTLVNLEDFKIKKEIDIGVESGIVSGTINNKDTFALLISFGSFENPMFSGRKLFLLNMQNYKLEDITFNLNIDGQIVNLDAEPRVAKFISYENVLIGLTNGILLFYNIHTHKIINSIAVSKNSLHTISLNSTYNVALIIDTRSKLFLLNLKNNQTGELTILDFDDEISGAISPDALTISIAFKYKNQISTINLFDKDLSNIYAKFNVLPT